MLIEIKHYLRSQKRQVSLLQMAGDLHMEPDTLRHMLQHWVQKGRVQSCAKKPACGATCTQCSPFVTEMYRWLA